MRILLVEDERRLAAAVKWGLESHGFVVDVAHTGIDGLWAAEENDYAAIVLDVMLPGLNGFKVCATLRQAGDTTPIMMLTAKDGEYDEAEGLDTGADDYLTKPLELTELLARVRLQSLVSEYGWSLWGSIQASASTLDFDFEGWGQDRLDKAVATFRGPRFERLLDEVTGG